MAKEDDWRLRGQEDYLRGATLVRKKYKAWSPEWKHDHCEFCWAEFREAGFSLVAEHHNVLTEGYSVRDRRPEEAGGTYLSRVYIGGRIEEKDHSTQRDDYWWVCPSCVADFAERFEWTVIDDLGRT